MTYDSETLADVLIDSIIKENLDTSNKKKDKRKTYAHEKSKYNNRRNIEHIINIIVGDENIYDSNKTTIGYEVFVKNAIIKLRDTNKSKGIHAVYSGFNKAFRNYYNDDPVSVIKELAKQGDIEIKLRKGGVMIYISGEAPKLNNAKAEDVLKTILADD